LFIIQPKTKIHPRKLQKRKQEEEADTKTNFEINGFTGNFEINGFTGSSAFTNRFISQRR
jgi:hypothetical protein